LNITAFTVKEAMTNAQDLSIERKTPPVGGV
jgi:hypothetical protein